MPKRGEIQMPKINAEKSLMRPMSPDEPPTHSTDVLLDFEEIGHFLNENTGVSETAKDRPSCLPVAQKLRQVYRNFCRNRFMNGLKSKESKDMYL